MGFALIVCFMMKKNSRYGAVIVMVVKIMNLASLIASKVDLVEYINSKIDEKKGIRLKKSGRGWKGQCPVHDGDGDGTIYVTPPTYYCFSCGSGGNIINFVADFDDLTYDMAVEKLADELNIDWSQNETYTRQKTIVEENSYCLINYRKNLPKIIDYLTQKRGFTPEICTEFQLGYHDGLMIPIRDINGRTVAFAKRQFDKKPKYINDKNNEVFTKSEILYNLDKARKILVKTNELYVAEGYLDAISGHQQNYACVAYMSQTISKEQIQAIKDLAPKPSITVKIAPDNDETGLRQIANIREKFQQYAPKCNVRVVKFPDGIKDFNDALVAGIDIGKLPTEHIDLHCIKVELEKCTNMEGEYLTVSEFIQSITNKMIRADIAKYLADRWGRTVEDVKQWLDVAKDQEEIINKFKSASQCVKEYQFMIANDDGITLGYNGIDESLDGVRKTDCIFIGASPGIGKTGIGIEAALHLASKGKRVAFFSLEMSAASLYERIIANLKGLNTRELKQLVLEGKIDLAPIVEKLSKRIVVIDESNLSLEDIIERVKVGNAICFDGLPIDAVVIDYIQIMKGVSEFKDLEATVVGLKNQLAKPLNLVVVALSQLNRETKSWMEPDVSQLKGSGALEASADVILLLWKEEENPKLTLAEKQALLDVISVKIGKARRGCTQKYFQLKYDRVTSRIIEFI